MEIKTKYELGQKIWVVYASKGEVSLYSDEITSITFENNELMYLTRTSSRELREEDIIMYDEIEKLLIKIKELDKQGE